MWSGCSFHRLSLLHSTAWLHYWLTTEGLSLWVEKNMAPKLDHSWYKRNSFRLLIPSVTSLEWDDLARSVQFSSVTQLCLFATSWTVACQVSLSITNSWSLLKLMSIESVMPSNHLILCRPLLLLPSIFHSIRVFSKVPVLQSGGQSMGISASASVLAMNIQDWFPLGWTGWISLQSKGLSRVFSSTTVQKH